MSYLLAAVLAARLIVFQQGGSLAARELESKALPKLREMVEARGITLDLRDAHAGAPAEVHLTPLLVYQDANGRSIFRGRYTDLDRIGQFLRTVRAGPLSNAESENEDIPVWRRGRAVVTAPVKITSLTGTIPARHDERAFADRARRAILSGFKRFRLGRRVVTGPSDRSFYMDFHPYRDPAGKLFVSTAIYSGFDCVEPAYRGFDEPVAGTWAEMDDVFARAAKTLEDQVAQLSVSSRAGDAFDPLADDNPLKSWDALGLALPPALPAAERRAASAAFSLPRSLAVAAPKPDDPPRLEFRFSPPLDSYSGEARTLTGAINLGPGSRLLGASGTLEAATSSVTMGNKTLDSEIRGTILRVDAFPTARFVLDPVETGDVPFVPGALIPFTATGRLEMLGATLPLAVHAEAEAGTDDDRVPILHVRATFRVRIGAAFGLKGPDGPSPANDTLEFVARFELK